MSDMLSLKQSATLALLRVSLGMLLFWWGLSKILQPSRGTNISNKFYSGFFSDDMLQYYFGYLQVMVGIMVTIGLLKRFAVPTQLIITGGSSLAIWNALLDPFALYLPVAKVAPIQHLFYPSVIALAGAVVLIALRDQDYYSFDKWIERISARRSMSVDSTSIAAE